MNKAKAVATARKRKVTRRARRNGANSARKNGANGRNGAARRRNVRIPLTERERAKEALRAKDAELEQVVTERKRSEGAAMRLAAVVQSSHDAVVAKDLNGIITDWNRSAERIFGYKPNEIIGKSILTLIPKNRHDEEKEILRKIRRGQSIEHYQTVRRRKDGRLIDVSLTISPIKDATGKIVGVSKIARDITKQKISERRLAVQARLLDLSSEAILVRDREDRITYWNRGAQEIYGYRPEEALGQVTHKLLRTEHPESLEAIYKKLERDNRWVGELTHRRKDGTKIFVMSHWAVDRDELGQRAFVLETNADISIRKRGEVALQRSKELLEKLVQQRTQALRLANTELETEISRRKGLEGQILEISDREQERLGQELHDGLCQQLTAIGFLARATALRLRDHRVVQHEDLEKIAQLINGSVMDARNIAHDLHKEHIGAPEFVQAMRDLVERKIWQTPCRLQLKTSVEIEDDNVASQLYRILREAIVNANKHARARHIVLEVKRSGRDLVFSVIDDGVGLRKTKGHGLGFHIMKYRAESIGARLELEALKKPGTRVTCYLPLANAK
jgi:PAS domain S-box-containing protein